MARHELRSTPRRFIGDSGTLLLPPVLRIRSGDEVTVHNGLRSSRPYCRPTERAFPRSRRNSRPGDAGGPGAHILTGPIYVEGAAPGDVLQVDILDIPCVRTGAATSLLRSKGTLTEDFS